jgi:hypothetical protein
MQLVMSLQCNQNMSHMTSHHFRPKPSHSVMAFNTLSFVFSLLLYSGSSITSKQVWDVGSEALSGPIRWILNPRFPSPPIGALFDPKERRRTGVQGRGKEGKER